MGIAVGMAVTVLAGFCVAHRCAPRTGIAEKLAAGYGLGLAVTTFGFFLLSWAGVPLTPLAGMVLPAVTVVLAAVVRPRAGSAPRERPSPEGFPDPLEYVLLAGIVILVGITAVQAVYWPVRATDAIHLYDNMARLVYSQKGIALGSYSRELYEFYADYPLHVSLSHVWVYLLAGRDDANPHFLYVGYFVSLLVIFYSRLRARARRRDALLVTLILASTPAVFGSVPWCSTTFPMGYYYAAGVFYLCEYFSVKAGRGARGYALLGALFLACLSWVRPASEVILLSIALVLGIHCRHRREWFPLAAFLAAAALVYGAWGFHLRLVERPYRLATFALGDYRTALRGDEIAYVLKGCFWDLAVSPGESGVAWYCFVAALLAGIARGDHRLELVWIILLNAGGLLVLLYLIGVQCAFAAYWRFNAWNAATRMMPMFAPLLLYYAGLIFFSEEDP